MSRFTINATTAPTTANFIRISGSASREYLVDYITSGIVTTTNVLGRCFLQRATTAGTNTARTPEKLSSRYPAFHGTCGVSSTVDPTLTGNPLLFVSVTTNPRRNYSWRAPRTVASVDVIDTEILALNKNNTTSAQQFVVGFSDNLTNELDRRVRRRQRNRQAYFTRSHSNQLAVGVLPARVIDYGVAWYDKTRWPDPRSKVNFDFKLLDTNAPISGSTTFNKGFSGRVTGAKIATSAIVRAIDPIVARATTNKIGLGSSRFITPLVERITPTKIALGSTRSVQTTNALISGSPVSTVVQGSARFVVDAIARITGTKIATSSAVGEIPIVVRPTNRKISLTSLRGSVPVVGRAVNIKIGLTSAIFTTPIVERVSGTKTLAQGNLRAIISAVATNTSSKIATSGTTRTTATIIGRFTGTSSTAIQGSARFAVEVLARITGTKIAKANVLVETPVTSRITQSKIALNPIARGFATITSTVSNRKIALSSARFTVPIIERVSGTKSLAQGNFRAIVGLVATNTSSKISTSGVVRTTSTVVARITGTSSSVVSGLSRFTISITARVTGTKIGTSSIRASVNPVARITNRKIAQSSITGSVSVIGRVANTKIGTITARFIASIAGRGTGTKTAKSSIRGLVPVIFRPVVKIATDRFPSLAIRAVSGVRHVTAFSFRRSMQAETNPRNITASRPDNKLKVVKNNDPLITIFNNNNIVTSGPQIVEESD